MSQHRDWKQDEETHKAQHVGNPPTLMPTRQRSASVDQGGERVANEAEPFVFGQALESNAIGLCAVAGDRDREERSQDHRVLWFGLDANAVGPQGARAVAAQNRPHDRDCEHEAGCVTNERIRPVHVAFEELESGWNLMIDLEHCRYAEQHHKAEVHHRVHDSRARLAQQRLHVDASAKILEPLLCVLGGGRAVVGLAALPVLHT